MECEGRICLVEEIFSISNSMSVGGKTEKGLLGSERGEVMRPNDALERIVHVCQLRMQRYSLYDAQRASMKEIIFLCEFAIHHFLSDHELRAVVRQSKMRIEGEEELIIKTNELHLYGEIERKK